MVNFYECETTIGLLLASLPALLSLYLFFIRGDRRVAIAFLLLSALLLRLLMISLDPYLHEWDERFHAAVAKHMVDSPFRPVLFPFHVIPYNVADWSYNHVWVHKQPLFLWQMALSMKLFGIHVMAMRLPSALLGVFIVWCVYDMGRKWTKDDLISYISALLATFSWFTLELISGRHSLDHNDLAFTAYMTGACWALANYIYHHFSLKWALAVGLFAGLATLNKWLVGLLIYGGWGLYLLLSISELNKKKILHLAAAAVVTCAVFLPWQWYIMQAFPLESAAAYKSNWLHFTDDLGHPDTNWSHLLFLPVAYHPVLVLLCLPVGLIMSFRRGAMDRKLTISFISMIVVLFVFFSVLVKCKMPAFVYPVSGLMFVLMAIGISAILQFISRSPMMKGKLRNWVALVVVLVFTFCHFKLFQMAAYRSGDNEKRNSKIKTAQLFRNLKLTDVQNRIVFNTKSYDNIDLMFYQNTVAYHYYFTEKQLDSLQAQGYKFTAFDYDIPALPDYVLEDPEIIILSVK